ncbi:ABC transporter ATP-binding protein [Amycolatopsis acidiphila]|uniref:ABC transporter ATP-binding protein n=1 Tax=Amycolatopsis acidiphila TaxID=715473 RepID=A0A558AIY5_9PSEU|nr:ABC transporter ATP-binding protein [Amycolatopsis acidiphila]TVT24224.1 ABC transporter ATP-binding protein [Amycolatopsis acidiphila]UIJ62648.1 ABC transporter ATP-binding protein [Amycolatopsis acidiphila]GHG85946.1 mannosyltransferase [Amycolatopsis acidiphila]
MHATTPGTADRDEPPAIELRGVTKRFTTDKATPYTALRDLDLEVAPGEFCAVVGPTGCGKSTTLTLVSGLERPSTGSVEVHGRRVSGITPGVGFMFQTDAILPWKTVLDNVSAGPRFRGTPKRQALDDARDWIRRVGLNGFEDRYPHQLSGGMRKRVALAQNLITEPRVILMDEPFSALDVQTRAKMSTELLALWDLTRPAVVFVTHDLEEAIALADTVVVLTAGPAATVKARFAIDLPRPRVVQEIRFEPRFVDIYHQIWEALRAEVDLAYAQTTQLSAKESS